MATNLNNGCPYRGLDPYKEIHQEYFFGRERDTERIASNLFVAPLTVLYGSSGVGKSSVLQAGAIPHLRENEKCVVVFFGEWQADFDQALKKEVLRELSANLNASSRNTTAPSPAGDNGAKKITEESILQSIGEALQKKTTPTRDSLRLDELLVGGARAFNRRILIIFDQFEEYFLYHGPTKGAAGFDAEFARAVNQQDSDVNFMLAMREEELSKLDRFRRRIPTLLSNLLRLDHLDDQAAHNAIEKPLEVYNKKYPSEQMGIEPALIEEIIRQVQPQPTAVDEDVPTLAAHLTPPAETGTKIETPFLQLVLVKLWQAETERKSSMLRLKTFQDLGGAKQIARDHLDTVMGQLTDQQRAVAASVLRFLVTPKGSKIALDAATLAGFANQKQEDVEAVLILLSIGNERILRKVNVPGRREEKKYELFHDVLGPAILDWRARYVQEQRVVEERAEAKKAFLLERQRRMRQAVVVLVVLLMMMGGLTVWAFVQRSDANQQRAEAVRQTIIAQEALKKAQQAQDDLKKEKDKVEEERDRTKDKARLLEISEAKARTNEQAALTAKAAALTAQRTAEDERDRADKQAKLVKALNEIMDLDLYGFDYLRAGDADRALEYFTQALEKTKQQNDRSMEAYNLLNIGDSYAIRGGVLQADQLRTFDLIKDKLEDTEAMIVNLYATMVGRDTNKLKEDKVQAETYYNHALTAVQDGAGQNKQTEAVLNQRLGDLFLTAEIPSLSDEDKGDKREPNFAKAIGYYEKASDYFRTSRAYDLQGALLNRIGILLSIDENNGENLTQAVTYYERAKSAFEQAQSDNLSIRSKVRPKQASVLFKLGNIYSKGPAANVAKAIECYEGAARIYESLEQFGDQGDMLSLVGGLSAGMNNADRAFASYSEAYKAFQRAASLGTDRQRAQSQNKALDMLTTIGSVYKNDPAQRPKIVAFYESVIPIYNQDASAKAGILHKIAEIFKTADDKTAAITYLARERQVYQQAGNHLKEGDVLVDIGLLYRTLKDDEKFRDHFDRARAAYSQVTEDQAAENRSSLVGSYMTIARGYSDEGDKLSAVRTYVEALNKTRPRAKDKNSGDYRIADLVQLGSRLLVDLRPDLRDEEATKFFQAVSSYYQLATDPYGASEGGALEIAARYYTEVTNPRRALEYYKQAREAYQRKNYYYQFDVLKRIGKVYFLLNHPTGASSYFDEAVKSYAKKNEQASALMSIGSFYAEQGLKREAVSAYEKALPAKVETKDISGQATVLRILSGLYKELGELEKAAELARQADALVVKR